MEGEKKRKRADHDHRHQTQVELRSKEKDLAPAPAPVMVQPSEEEVEEFFTILRRMNVAIKYFDKGGTGKRIKVNGNGNGNGDGAKRTVAEVAQIEGLNNGRERSMGVAIAKNGGRTIGLDLNVVPETEI